MKCKVTKMRKAGVAVPKYDLKKQVHWTGDLVVLDVRDDGVNRVIKTARLATQAYDDRQVNVLFEPHLVWMADDRFTLQGFERVLHEGKVVEYAQSWLCQVEHDGE